MDIYSPVAEKEQTEMPNNHTELVSRVLRVKERIAKAADASGRDPACIKLVAATKTVPSAAIREAASVGIDAAGENRVQEMIGKIGENAYDGIPLHFIGHLQKNKLRQVTGEVELIQSADSADLILGIAQKAQALDIVQDLLIEINIGRENSKSGIIPELLPELIEYSSKQSGIRILGLMAIPPYGEPKETRGYFAQMYKLFVDNNSKKYDNVTMSFLSMGMSADYYEAILEGSNMVRIGSAIFGTRS